MKYFKPSLIVKPVLASVCLIGMQSCFTGVEGTGKITISKKDISIVAPSEEDMFLSDLLPEKLRDWLPGKEFMVTDDKLRLITETNGETIKTGDIIQFKEITGRHGADGIEKTGLIFDNNGTLLVYPLDKTVENAKDQIVSSDLSMLIDLDVVKAARKKLSGKTVWTKTPLWYGDSMEYIKGRKFVAVTITDVEPGNSFFPLKVSFTDRQGNQGRLLMNIGNAGNDSRAFSRLFSLRDPRENYRHISEENWQAIQNENILLGMTKEECRLSKGNPSDVDTGHDYTSTMEIWYYPNGSYVRFLDGLIVGFK